MTLKYIWRSFQPRLSFPRPLQLSLACFRVARSPGNSWASCIFCPMQMQCIALDRQKSAVKSAECRSTEYSSTLGTSLIGIVRVQGTLKPPVTIWWRHQWPHLRMAHDGHQLRWLLYAYKWMSLNSIRIANIFARSCIYQTAYYTANASR